MAIFIDNALYTPPCCGQVGLGSIVIRPVTQLPQPGPGQEQEGLAQKAQTDGQTDRPI